MSEGVRPAVVAGANAEAGAQDRECRCAKGVTVVRPTTGRSTQATPLSHSTVLPDSWIEDEFTAPKTHGALGGGGAWVRVDLSPVTLLLGFHPNDCARRTDLVAGGRCSPR